MVSHGTLSSTVPASLAGQLALEIQFLHFSAGITESLPVPHFYTCSGIRPLVLTFAGEGLYPLNHLSSPEY